MPHLDATIEFEVFCDSCGKGLCAGTTTGLTSRRLRLYASVDPCETCLEKACREGRDEANGVH